MENKFNIWNNEKHNLDKLNYDDFYINPRDICFTKMWYLKKEEFIQLKEKLKEFLL